jgi:hypothetical protein
VTCRGGFWHGTGHQAPALVDDDPQDLLALRADRVPERLVHDGDQRLAAGVPGRDAFQVRPDRLGQQRTAETPDA